MNVASAPTSQDPAAAQDSQKDRPIRPEAQRPSPRSAVVTMVPILVVLITFLFWYQTWFGRPMTDQEMGKLLADTSVPHKTQHALAQLSERMARGDVTARRWYPQLLSLARDPHPQLRMMAGWAMGQDNHAEEFHQPLRSLVEDPAPLVRWNAALALARFGDAAGEPQLRLMLEPFTVVAPGVGTVELRSREHEAVRPGSVIARLRPGQGLPPVDVVSPLAGEISRWVARDGTSVAAGDALAIITPAESQVWEALRALYLVGQLQDLEDVDRYARGVPDMPERIRQQAVTTAQAIRRRAAGGKS